MSTIEFGIEIWMSGLEVDVYLFIRRTRANVSHAEMRQAQARNAVEPFHVLLVTAGRSE